MEKGRLESIERYIFALFRSRRTTRLLAREIFESTEEFANADMVRAFEDLEKKWRFIVRYTKEGHDWVSLTPEGAAYGGVEQVATEEQPDAPSHPPKSVT